MASQQDSKKSEEIIGKNLRQEGVPSEGVVQHHDANKTTIGKGGYDI